MTLDLSFKPGPKRKRPKDASHCVLTKLGGMCLNCGARMTFKWPVEVKLLAGSMKAFARLHRGCEDPGGEVCHFCNERGHAYVDCPVTRSFDAWRICEDHGASSNAILDAALGGPDVKPESMAHPLDAQDFGRCYRLLHWHRPSLRHGVVILGRHSAAWARLAAAWDELCALYEEEQANRGGEAPKLHARIKELVGS